MKVSHTSLTNIHRGGIPRFVGWGVSVWATDVSRFPPHMRVFPCFVCWSSSRLLDKHSPASRFPLPTHGRFPRFCFVPPILLHVRLHIFRPSARTRRRRAWTSARSCSSSTPSTTRPTSCAWWCWARAASTSCRRWLSRSSHRWVYECKSASRIRTIVRYRKERAGVITMCVIESLKLQQCQSALGTEMHMRIVQVINPSG